jgi:hypothetical protein
MSQSGQNGVLLQGVVWVKITTTRPCQSPSELNSMPWDLQLVTFLWEERETGRGLQSLGSRRLSWSESRGIQYSLGPALDLWKRHVR